MAGKGEFYVYYGCCWCKGLLISENLLQDHVKTCDGSPENSGCDLFACSRTEEILNILAKDGSVKRETNAAIIKDSNNRDKVDDFKATQNIENTNPVENEDDRETYEEFLDESSDQEGTIDDVSEEYEETSDLSEVEKYCKMINDVRKYVCPKCSHETRNASYLSKHLSLCLDSPDDKESQESKSRPSNLFKQYVADDSEVVFFACPKCPKKISNKSLFSKHLALCNGRNSPSSTFFDKYKHLLTKKNGKSVFCCNVCSKESRFLAHFHRHMISCHSSESTGVWKCPHCPFTSHVKNSHKQHLLCHTKPAMCEFCSKRFPRKTDLLKHQLTHTGELPFQCTECEYKCRSNGLLQIHRKKHSGDLIKCTAPGCEFSTIYKSALTTHFRTQHTEEKRFQCDLCPYRTNDPSSYKVHVKVHNNEKDFKCVYCEYHAVTKHMVIRHMRVHTKTKIYSCDKCSFSTAHSHSLKVHMMTHLGIKPWQCAICGYNSVTKQKAAQHIKNKHKTSDPSHLIHLGLSIKMATSSYRNPTEQPEYTTDVHIPEDTVVVEDGIILTGETVDENTVCMVETLA